MLELFYRRRFAGSGDSRRAERGRTLYIWASVTSNDLQGAKKFHRGRSLQRPAHCRVRGANLCNPGIPLWATGDGRAVDMARAASELGADAILVQDIGLARILKKAVPDILCIASTQMSIHNLDGVKAAAEMGMTCAVLARELSLSK